MFDLAASDIVVGKHPACCIHDRKSSPLLHQSTSSSTGLASEFKDIQPQRAGDKHAGGRGLAIFISILSKWQTTKFGQENNNRLKCA